jgi:hydrogenase maturation factor
VNADEFSGIKHAGQLLDGLTQHESSCADMQAPVIIRGFDPVDFANLFSFLGIILLIGIVKKNAIMIVDFALDAQRAEGLEPARAV